MYGIKRMELTTKENFQFKDQELYVLEFNPACTFLSLIMVLIFYTSMYNIQ